MKYYHISPIENKESILNNGLKANEEGNIFLLDDILQCENVAINQIFCLENCVFEIDAAGIVGDLENDTVAEYGTSHQFLVEQQVIKPQHIKYLHNLIVSVDRSYDLGLKQEEQQFNTRGQSTEQFIEYIKTHTKKTAAYNRAYGTDIKANPDAYDGGKK